MRYCDGFSKVEKVNAFFGRCHWGELERHRITASSSPFIRTLNHCIQRLLVV